MARRPKTATVYDVVPRHDLKGGKARFPVRWKTNGRMHTKTFATQAEAAAFHDELEEAAVDRERFDSTTGLPASMIEGDGITIAEQCRAFLLREQGSYTPKSRHNIAVDLIWLIVAAAPDQAPRLAGAERSAVVEWMAGRADLTPRLKQWLKRWSPRVRDLDTPALTRILERIALREDGIQPLGAATASNRRSHARQVLNDAVERGLVKPLVWPSPKRGGKKKSARKLAAEIKTVPTPPLLLSIIRAQRNRDQRSHKYMVMSAISGLAGLRPSEVFALEIEGLNLPATGWGEIQVLEARVSAAERWRLDGDEEYDITKSQNSTRAVPIPSALVRILRDYLDQTALTAGRLFPEGFGSRHWIDSLKLACDKLGVDRITPYDLRRSYANHLDAAGMRRSEIARRMGHTLAVLEKRYLRPMVGIEESDNQRVDEYFHEFQGLADLGSK